MKSLYQILTTVPISNELVEPIDERYKKRIYQFIGFTESQVEEFAHAIKPNKGLIINDKFHIDVEKHDTFELIKLSKHKSNKYES
jgi:hypothetical protein